MSKKKKRNPIIERVYGKVKRALKSGKILKSPCEICGDFNTNSHHDDYSKPLDVRWLCRSHHIQHHLIIQGKSLYCIICGKLKPCGGKNHSKLGNLRIREKINPQKSYERKRRYYLLHKEECDLRTRIWYQKNRAKNPAKNISDTTLS